MRRTLDGSGLTPRTRYHIELVFDEVVTNIIRHGHTDSAADIDACVELGPDDAVLTFEDGGEPFDPRQQPEPVHPRSLEDARPGGLGLMLVRKAARQITYERTPEQRNRLTVIIDVG